MKIIPVLASLLLLTSCTSRLPQASAFATSFPAITLKDTTIFAGEMGEGATASLKAMDTITLEDFNKYVPDSLHEPIAHILEGGDPVIQKLGRFPLDAYYDALAIDIQAFWFRNQSVLIFDKKQQTVIGLFPVAEFYGGDGGQILRQSWLLSKQNIMQALIVRESEHALKIEEASGEPQDLYAEWGARYLWQKNKFVEQPTSDSLALIKAFPIDWGF